jgi:alpha-tubulin suppressor-like RCC1 family protein
MGNRTTVVEIPPSTPPAPSLITVASLPKKVFGDHKYNPMMVLLSSGELIGWGNNSSGSLANGLGSNTTSVAQRLMFDPNTTPPLATASIVDWSFTSGNTYIVYSNGWVYSAGVNDYGQLGQGDTTARNQLKRIEYFVTNGISITNVWAAASVYATNGGGCAYFLSGTNVLYGVGANAAGNLANGTTTNQSTPVTCLGLTGLSGSPTISDLQMSSDDAYLACYLLMSNGTVMVAGANTVGQLGINTTTNRSASFTNALQAGGGNLTNITAISANGGFAGGSSVAGNALALDSSGNMWTTGSNVYGILGLGTATNVSGFTQITSLTNVIAAGLGGGYYGCGYAITKSGSSPPQLSTWGYGNNNSLFQNNTTTRIETPTLATLPSPPLKVFFARGEQLTNSAQQLFVLTSAGEIVYAGAANGQIGVASTTNPGYYYLIPSPVQILVQNETNETIDDIFVHGTSTAQRIFVLTSAGNLYASGTQANSICTGGVASDTAVANTAWFKISFMP